MNLHRCVSLFFLLASISAVVFAFISQYVFGLKPCFLCLLQRWPFFIAIASSVSVFVFHRFSKYFVWLTFLAYVSNCIIALYHTGLQFGYLPDIFMCSDKEFWDSVEDMERALSVSGAGLPSCRIATASFLGISMSSWNFIYCALCIVIGSFLSKIGCNFGGRLLKSNTRVR